MLWKMFIKLLLTFQLLQVCICYRKDGDFIFGAILPSTKSTGNSACNEVNPDGIAAAEAYIAALNRVTADGEFSSLSSKMSLGYDIRDNCNDGDKERKIAYEMGREAILHAENASNPKPVGVVLGAFTTTSTTRILNSENIPQVSYVPNNAKLTAADSTNPDLNSLISAYPENTLKMAAVLDIVKQLGHLYVHTVVSNDHQGKSGLDVLNVGLNAANIRHKDHVVSTATDLDNVINQINSNPLISTVIVHCSKDLEMKLYAKAIANNMTQFYIISTNDLNGESLTPYASLLDGGMFVKIKQPTNLMENYFKGVKVALPYTNQPWLKPLFLTSGTSDCIQNFPGVNETVCKTAETATALKLATSAKAVINAYISTYIIAHGLMSKTNSQSLPDAIKSLQTFTVSLFNENISMKNQLNVQASIFQIYGMAKDGTDVKIKEQASWDDSQSTKLSVNTPFKFKGNSDVVPTSTCAASCQPGNKLINEADCWICEKCPNGTVSTTVNAAECNTCNAGEVSNPEQSSCVKYTVETFDYSSGMGIFILFLVVVLLLFLLFAFIFFCIKRDHQLVLATNLGLLTFYILGLLLLVLCIFPLLAEPSTASCGLYIAMFNLGLTICFAVLMSRSAFMNGFYNDDGEVGSGCGPMPRALLIVIVVGLQVLILLVGLLVDEPETQHNDTTIWSVRYFECSSWASLVFWVGFGYNIALSIIGNFLSCTSTKMEEVNKELKWILICYCIFYLVGLFEVVIFYRYVDVELSEAQSMMCVIFVVCFYLTYLWPKIWAILFHTKSDGKSLDVEEHHEEHHTHHVHAADGFKNHGIIQMTIKEEADA